MTTLQKIGAGVVVILAILGAIAFFRGGAVSFGSTTFQSGEVQNNPFIFLNGFSAGSTQQLGVDASGNLNTSGTATFTGSTNVGVFSQGAGAVATTSTGTATLTAAQMLYGVIQHTNAGAATLTLPASTTMSSFAPTAGTCQQVVFLNVGTGVDTLAGGTGTLLAVASTTATGAALKTVNASGIAVLIGCRKVNTDLQFLMTPGS